VGAEGAAHPSGDDLILRDRHTRGRIDWARVAHRRAAARELDALLGVRSRPNIRLVYDLRAAA